MAKGLKYFAIYLATFVACYDAALLTAEYYFKREQSDLAQLIRWCRKTLRGNG